MNFLLKNKEKIVLYFLMCGSIIDVLTFFSVEYFHFQVSFGMFMRLFFLILLLFLFFLNKGYKKWKIFLGCFFFYTVFFFLYTWKMKGMDTFFYEGTSYLKTFYFPLTMIVLLPYKKFLEEVVDKKKFFLFYGGYLFFLLVPNILGLGFSSYNPEITDKIGSSGWFYSGNEVGGILSIFMPFLFAFCMKEKEWKKGIFIIVLLIVSIFGLGTKTPVFAFGLCIFFFLFFIIRNLIKEKRWKFLTVLSTTCVALVLVFIIFLPKTSFYKNIKEHMEFLGIHSFTEIFTNYHNFDHFIFSGRLTLKDQTKKIYLSSSFTEKMIGLGSIHLYGTDEVSIKTVEMDYYDILFNYGVLGFFFVFAPVVFTLWNQRKEKGIRTFAKNVSLLLIFLLALFQGHVFVAPAVSIYAACILFLGCNNLDFMK